MIISSLIITLTLIISALVMLISFLLSKKTVTDREKNTPFECGFDPKGSARLPFSLRFFLIAVIFLIFDVEITLLLPLAAILKVVNLLSWLFTGFFFILILLLGLYHEWNQGALDWAD
uniref:NADH dehydrogenase subunit 3 n=1 Tax=Alima pacifica TaxID=870555 RepID=UPI001EAB17DE|nr:NADH dehydrogenase subunit 3 [Alima pacifica]UGW52243.1 NADH dehydrogenase subunit 3 [Alima pacifica]